jgi:hypothetical protein
MRAALSRPATGTQVSPSGTSIFWFAGVAASAAFFWASTDSNVFPAGVAGGS